MNMEQILESDNRKFLLQSVKLNRAIDKYKQLLGLDPSEVALFKNDVELFLYVSGRYRSFAESFILYNIDTMRQRLLRMIICCTRSKNYTTQIGEELGIETPLHSCGMIFPEQGFLIGLQK
jgi:hypothetical protein